MQDKKMDMQALVAIIKRFKYDVRVNYYVMTEHGFENKPALLLYFKSTSNKIPRVPNAIEGGLKRFEIALRTGRCGKSRYCRFHAIIADFMRSLTQLAGKCVSGGCSLVYALPF